MAANVMKKQNCLKECKDWLAFDIMQRMHLNNTNKHSSHHTLLSLYVVDCGLLCQDSKQKKFSPL